MERIHKAIKEIHPQVKARILKHKDEGLALDEISLKVTLPLAVVSGVIYQNLLLKAKKHGIR